MLLDRQDVHCAELLELLSNSVAFGAQCRLVEIDRRRIAEELVERPSPLRLESLTNGGAAPRQLRVTELGVVQLLGGAPTATVGLIERAFDRRQLGIRRTDTRFGRRQARLTVRQRRGSCLEVESPGGGLLGERPIVR
jgi:hypothetical protein